MTECLYVREKKQESKARDGEKAWVTTMNLLTPPPSHPVLQLSMVLTMGSPEHRQSQPERYKLPTNHRNAL